MCRYICVCVCVCVLMQENIYLYRTWRNFINFRFTQHMPGSILSILFYFLFSRSGRCYVISKIFLVEIKQLIFLQCDIFSCLSTLAYFSLFPSQSWPQSLSQVRIKKQKSWERFSESSCLIRPPHFPSTVANAAKQLSCKRQHITTGDSTAQWGSSSFPSVNGQVKLHCTYKSAYIHLGGDNRWDGVMVKKKKYFFRNYVSRINLIIICKFLKLAAKLLSTILVR